MLDEMYIRAEDLPKEEPKPVPEKKKMVVKINSRPVLVAEEEEKEPINWVYLTVSTCGYLLALWIMDFVAATFLHVHPFPFIKFVGVILSWFGIS
jgi:hypothetical protein